MDAGFSILTGNRLGRLVEHLAHQMHERPLPPLEREVVIVQSQGMQRWLTLELARRRGLAASLMTPFPGPFMRYLFAQLRPRTRRPPSEPIASFEHTLFSRELLLWRLVESLGGGEASSSLAAPRAYLADDADQRKLYQLAGRLASLFDDYQLYRGDVLKEWEEERGQPEEGPSRWQAALWRELVAVGELDGAHAPLHRGLEALSKELRRHGSRPSWLPRRLSVLGVSSLPPAFIGLLEGLGELLPVTIYMLSPTYHYWADLRSEKETARLERRFAAESRKEGWSLDFSDQHFESGHPLLASLGKQGRELFDLLQRADPAGTAWHELAFEEPAGDGILPALQRSLLHLREPGPEDMEWRPGDRSIGIHICHSPMREMQVLHHELLRAFEEIPDLRPADVLVLLPDIENYVPYIQAVFGIARDGLPALPFSVADRGAGREEPPSEVILQILELASARFYLRDVFDLLETPAVRRTTGLRENEVQRLRGLCERAGIRWGLSREHREEQWEVAGDGANTWRMGLDRLLMGYATGRLGDLDESLVAGIAPESGDTAGDAESLGCLATFLTRLESSVEQIRRRRTLADWADLLGTLVDDYFLAQTEDEERGLQLIRQTAEELATAAGRLDAQTELSAAVIREHLQSRLRLDGFGSGFLNGQITFCALRPMRTIPFRVVAIAGLDAGIFPRRDRRPGFDLMAREPRLGDRSVREDDRYLFLETLLATEDRLILTHVGRSQQDGSERQPSAVLSELLEYLDSAFTTASGQPLSSELVRVHLLQPWSSRYFRESQDRGYSFEDVAVAQALEGPRLPEPPLIHEALDMRAGADEEGSTSARPAGSTGSMDSGIDVLLEDLVRFWQSPSRYFLQRSLGINLDGGDAGDLDVEPFALRGLQAWPVRKWLAELKMRELTGEGPQAGDEEAARSAEELLLRARGLLPPGTLGQASLAKTRRAIDLLMERVPEHRPLKLHPFALEVDGALGGRGAWRLAGVLDNLVELEGETGVIHFRPGPVRPVDWLRLWCEHLVWIHLSGTSRKAWLIGIDAAWHLGVPRQPEELLRTLLRGFEEGANRPLPFFDEPSMRYAEQEFALSDPRRRVERPPIDLARAVYEGRDGPPISERPPAVSEDPWVQLAFRGRDPLEEADFGTLSEAVWRPIFECRREVDR